MPKIFGAKGLSADDIAGISGVINDAGTTGGTSTAYTATLASRPNPLTDGYAFVCVFHATNGASATISLSSGTAQPLYANGAAAVAGDIVAGAPVLCRSDGTNVHILGVVGGYPNFGRVQFGTGSYADNIYVESGLIYTKTDAGQIMIYGGYNSGGGFYLNGNTRSSNPGCVTGFLGSASGARWSLQDKNAAEQLRVSEHGVRVGTLLSLLAESTIVNGVSANAGYWAISGGSTLSNAANNRWHGSAHATYPGAHQQFAPLSTRAASTAFAVCPVASGDAARVEFLTDGGDVYAEFTVVAAGGVYLERGNAAYWINTSSPGAVEIGVYISAGVLYCKPGSGFTGKISTFSKIGKA